MPTSAMELVTLDTADIANLGYPQKPGHPPKGSPRKGNPSKGRRGVPKALTRARIDQIKAERQSEIMYHLKLKRMIERNARLRNELAKDRIYASNACLSLIRYMHTTRDRLIPPLWGYLEEEESVIEEPSSTCCTIS
ncbi:Ste18p [Sugiyamaella lignohabitans]|uniref:Guanine nucleotide-binding protein subunit gamma n=1 Tax=Sugiyamaella lignohabitans TaxID=796027 RepID=A0A167CHS5_9ASCO|nr:Ste18p [Sugiyamaella lignohabitans]ANB11716.1 Ste18p [Sugiyamaella lignohabitans]